ncbi:hypothetical protein HELRODRAFT_184327, partial [Helobdella robusta]|uniref:Ig-like domain-containing protein n=1 Tax=Helobdella robusta TaxID=6412 RepID=T1FL03_HELRO
MTYWLLINEKHSKAWQRKQTFYDVQLEDTGNYTCEIRTRKGQSLARVTHHVIVIDPPKIICPNVYVTYGERMVNVTCHVISRPQPIEIVWFKYQPMSGNMVSLKETNGAKGHDDNWVIKRAWTHDGHLKTTLFFRKIKVESFETFLLVVRNPVHASNQSVKLFQ